MSNNGSQDRSSLRRRFTDAKLECDSVIGPDVVIKGDVRGSTNMEFRGTLEGSLDLDGFLWLGSDGRIDGDVSVTDLLVEGDVRGDMRVRGKAELRSSCHVEGDIVATALAIADGGFFEGSINMGGAPSSREDVGFKERRSPDE
jgi:cytoskeletal protein CcmA (bactofilin family)